MVNKIVVQQNPDGNWSGKRPGNQRATPNTTARTQKEAIALAHEVLAKSGGGELVWRGRDGAFKGQNTVPPGNDPRRSKG